METTSYLAIFAIHPDGFCVFLPVNEIRKFDEYAADGDPYAVADGIDSPFHEQRQRVTLDLVGEGLRTAPASSRILDVGFDGGHITAAIQQRYPKVELSAFDASLSAIKRVNQLYTGLRFDVADAHCPPYSRAYFDCAICNNLWEHVSGPIALLNGVSRCLKPGGTVVVSTPSRYGLNNLLRVFAGRSVAFASRHHVTEYSVGQVLEQMQWSGFAVEKIAGKLLTPSDTGVRAFTKYRLIAHKF